ncbi:hypothetical protein IHE48_09670 [Frankia sp. CH37]|nr:hypothetical protein [Parafrankia sp. CH37]
MFTVGGGVSSLAGLTAGTAQIVLRAITALLTLYLVYTFSNYYRISRVKDSTSTEDVICDIEDVVTRQAAPHDEVVHVRITIGRTKDDDRVEEEVHVTPNSQVVNRLIRPIMPYHWRRPDRLRDIEFDCSVDESDDGQVLVRARPMLHQEYLQIWLIFTPTLTKPTVWRFWYRPRGLWNELREKDRDRLVWNDIMPSNGRSPLTDFTITFVFADPGFKPGVTERNGYGTVKGPDRSETGEWVVEWRDPSPQGRRYEWTITRRAL